MGFLSSMLPMVAGAASTYFTGNPYLGMALAGGVTAKQTGSLQKGLVAGLGAYGGGQLATGLTASAATTVPEAAQLAAGAGDATAGMNAMGAMDKTVSGLSGLGTEAGRNAFITSMGGGTKAAMAGLSAAAPMMVGGQEQQPQMQVGDSTMPQRLKYNQGTATPFPQPDVPGYGDLGQDFGRQNSFFPNSGYQQITPEEAKSIRGYAAGGYAMGGGPVEQMSNAAAIGENTGYPQADITGHAYATPWQTPVSQNVVQGSADTGVNRMSGQMLAGGGTVNLQGTIDLGGGGGGGGQFGQASANGYQPVGSGGGMMGGGFDQRAIAANPQGFQQYMSDAQYREQQMPGSTFLSQMGQAGLGALSGLGFANGGLNLAGKYSRDLPNDLDNTYAKAERVDDKSIMRGIKQEQGLRERLRNPQMRAAGGLSHLGDYSDGGRLLKGPGDGVSDSIPAVIGKKQPARLADGEFVVPARIVSELGNGSTEAGARKLYAMMDRVQSARGKTVGKGKVAKNSRADRYLPA